MNDNPDRSPGRIDNSQTSNHISGFQDMMPTFVELAGLESQPGMDRISILPALFETGNQISQAYLYREFHGQGGRQAIRKGD